VSRSPSSSTPFSGEIWPAKLVSNLISSKLHALFISHAIYHATIYCTIPCALKKCKNTFLLWLRWRMHFE
jgi:hypothetical protein